jgi:anti-sigma regulatory factor (Ser/Thr protein kinase)
VSGPRILDAAAQGKAVRLSALPGAPKQARSFVVGALEQWNASPETIEAAELIVSELVTNALLHTGRADGLPEAGPTETVKVIRVRVGVVVGNVVIEVWDNSTQLPVLNSDPLDTDAEGGRGLFLVGELSKDWGYFLPQFGGKVVWASIG